MKQEAHLDGIGMKIRLQHLKRKNGESQQEQILLDPLQQLLAPGMTWEEVANKHQVDIHTVQKRILAYLEPDEAYDWLKGNVGGGKLLMDEHRGTILAEVQFQDNLATYAKVPHKTEPFYDHESGSPLFSDPVKLDLRGAEDGLEIIGENLVQTIGRGTLDTHSLGFYLHCWDNTAQTIIKLLKEREVLVPKPLGEFGINPRLLPQPLE